jgi:hypothetical protein
MTRLEALEAVAEAGRGYRRARDGGPSVTGGAWVTLLNALMTLDALPAAPTQGQGETVEVAVWRTEVEYRFGPLTTQSSRVLVGAGYSLLGTTLLPIRATEGGGE